MISQCAYPMALSFIVAFVLGLFFTRLVAGAVKLMKWSAIAAAAILFIAGVCCLLGVLSGHCCAR
jgi:hypothetical protein